MVDDIDQILCQVIGVLKNLGLPQNPWVKPGPTGLVGPASRKHWENELLETEER
jgi:hypothetical protein